MNDEALRICVDDITTQVLTTWYRARTTPESEQSLPLTRALAAIAYADGKCEMLPQAAWLNARFRSSETEDGRAAIADAVCRMALTSRAPEKLVTTALHALRDTDRFLQARHRSLSASAWRGRAGSAWRANRAPSRPRFHPATVLGRQPPR